MKFTINGFSQKKLVEFGLDALDALILRYFVDFKDSSKMVTKNVEDKLFYWLKYETINKELPVLKLKKDSVYRRLKKMCDCGVLEHVTVKKKGVYSFYRLGNKYEELISDTSDTNPTPIGNESEPIRNEIRTHTDLNPEQKINLLNNQSTKDSSTKDIYIEIIEYLNGKTGLAYRAKSKKTQQLIKARISEGFKIEDFFTVINKKTKEWKGTEFEKYLRPETLFGTKFEGYLNQKVRNASENFKDNKGNFNNYEQREYDYQDLEKQLTGWKNNFGEDE